MNAHNTVTTWDPTDYVAPHAESTSAPYITVFIEQIEGTDLLKTFQESLSQNDASSHILKGILKLSETYKGGCNQTRIRLKVNEDGSRQIIGMDWIGFIDTVFFVSPSVFLDDISEAVKADFRQQAFKFLEPAMPSELIFASHTNSDVEQSFIEKAALEEVAFTNTTEVADLDTLFGKGIQFYLPKP
jgi:hypothetical protein